MNLIQKNKLSDAEIGCFISNVAYCQASQSMFQMSTLK